MNGDKKMNKHSPIKLPASLLERASEKYDFGAALRVGAGAPAPVAAPAPVPPVVVAQPLPVPAAPAPIAPVAPTSFRTAAAPPAPASQSGRFAQIDRARLVAANMIDPDGPVTGLSEEFRIVKRQLLLAARGGKGLDPVDRGERILICSAHPNEGKTFCAINLALSMASERTIASCWSMPISPNPAYWRGWVSPAAQA